MRLFRGRATCQAFSPDDINRWPMRNLRLADKSHLKIVQFIRFLFPIVVEQLA